MTTTAELYRPGLEGIIAGETAICTVEQGGLQYRGYDIAELAEQASFEECAYLLLLGELPTAAELLRFRNELNGFRALPGVVLDTVAAIPAGVPGMDVLRSTVSLVAHFDPITGDDRAARRARATRLLAVIPGLVAARLRLQAGLPPVEPEAGLSHAAQFWWQAFGRRPTELEERIINLTLILYAEHEFNASTFAARVCMSTLSDLYSATVAAIGTLKGPLHGGANEETAKLFQQFDSAKAAEQWVRGALARREKIMGFGHRVYREGDHRARILERFIEPLGREREATGRVAAYFAIKDAVWNAKKIHMNLDYPCGMVYLLLGLPLDVYTPLFVASRISGWCAHAIEQVENNRLIRPRSRYIGPPTRKFVPLAQR